MASSLVDVASFPPEIIGKIATFLPVPDVLKCMLVCKSWKVVHYKRVLSEVQPVFTGVPLTGEYLAACFIHNTFNVHIVLQFSKVISSESFYKTYTLSHYNFDDEEQPSGHLEVWQNPEECFCYWNDDKNDDDESDFYVFADPPKRWKCGIVHLAEYKLESDKELRYKDFFRAVAILMKIQKAADELQLDCGIWGNESDGVIEVCLFPWSKDTLPTPRDIITMFHFHPELSNNPMESTALSDDEDNYDEEDDIGWNGLRSFTEDDKQKAVNFFKWLKKIFTPFIYIGIGCDLMNPVVCFLLGHIAPGWVGGVLTSVVCT